METTRPSFRGRTGDSARPWSHGGGGRCATGDAVSRTRPHTGHLPVYPTIHTCCRPCDSALRRDPSKDRLARQGPIRGCGVSVTAAKDRTRPAVRSGRGWDLDARSAGEGGDSAWSRCPTSRPLGRIGGRRCRKSARPTAPVCPETPLPPGGLSRMVEMIAPTSRPNEACGTLAPVGRSAAWAVPGVGRGSQQRAPLRTRWHAEAALPHRRDRPPK